MQDDDFFWGGVDRGQLLVQKCTSCGTVRHPPAPMCGHCHSLDWREEPLSGRGRVYAWLISKHPTQPDSAPRTVVLVDLEEGVRMISNIEDGGAVEIGDPVEVVFRKVGDTNLPQFRRVVGAAQ
jgi:uncharacterized OB-fold protein